MTIAEEVKALQEIAEMPAIGYPCAKEHLRMAVDLLEKLIKPGCTWEKCSNHDGSLGWECHGCAVDFDSVINEEDHP